MKITLKKVLYCGFALLIALCFFLTLALPITLKVGDASYSGSLLSIINEGHGLDAIIKSDVLSAALASGSSTALSEIPTVVAVTRTTYSIIATIGLVIMLVALAATIGAFFLPSMKGARGLTIPFFAIGVIYNFVVAAMGTTLGQVTVAYAKGTEASASYIGIFLAIVAFVLFLAMLIVPGVVHEKVLVGKKEEQK